METKQVYGLYLPELDAEKIEKDYNEKLRDRIKENFKKILSEARAEMEQDFCEESGYQFVKYIEEAALSKARKLVEGILQGDEEIMKFFIKYNDFTRSKILNSVIDFAAKIEIEELKRENERLKESLAFYRL